MKGNINDVDMETVVTGNLKMMDRLLDSRKVTVIEKDAVKSEEALIAYINQSDYGRWILNSYAHLSDTDKVTFRNTYSKAKYITYLVLLFISASISDISFCILD